MLFLFMLIKVMPEVFKPSTAPDNGMYLDGLQIKNGSWDNLHSVLADKSTCCQDHEPLPILWVKPYSKEDTVKKATVKKSARFNVPEDNAEADQIGEI